MQLPMFAQWGRYEFRLCPLTDPSAAAEEAQLSEACLSQHQLQLADGTGAYLYPKVTSSSTIACMQSVLVQVTFPMPDVTDTKIRMYQR